MKRRSFLKAAGLTSIFATTMSGCANLIKSKTANIKIPRRSTASLSDGTTVDLDQWTAEYVDLWKNTSNNYPFNLKSFDFKTQSHNIYNLNNLGLKLDFEFSKITVDDPNAKNWITKSRQQILKTLAPIFGVAPDVLAKFEKMGLIEALVQYFKQAKMIDPSLSPADIFQAGRNVITANALQIISANKVETHEAILGYSLLYPYSDNIIDNRNLTNSDKLDFAGRFKSRLEGSQNVEPQNEDEKKIFQMVSLIEKRYPRSEFPEVYSSLLIIHSAQVESMFQQNIKNLSKVSVNDEFMMKTFKKGGASVFADAFLAAGHPSPSFAKFSFGFGVLLQLVDDLQDITIDRKAKTATIFNIAAAKGEVLDAYANQLFSFAVQIIGSMPSIDSHGTDITREVQSMLQNGVILLIVEAIESQKHLFGQHYVDNIVDKTTIGSHTNGSLKTIEQKFIQIFSTSESKIIQFLDLYSQN